MYIREAFLSDIPSMHLIRMTVKENALTKPLAILESEYVPFLTENGKVWLCEIANQVVHFALIDLHKSEV